MNAYDQIASLLIDLEALLRSNGLWAERRPSPQAMASTVPFAVDTMPLESWLQFIFIPRMRELAAAQAPMPANCEVLPVAEEAFDRSNRELFAVIARLDLLISQA